MFGKIRYYCIRLSHISFKGMVDTAKKVKKENKKLLLVILIDMVWCSIRYQAGYSDYYEFQFYLLKGKNRKTYLTGGISNKIIRYYNDKNSNYKFNNKIIFNQIFKDFIKRDWIDISECSKREFEKFCSKKEKIIVKPATEYAGKGIEVITLKGQDISFLYNRLREEKKDLVEEVLLQHEDMNKLYAGSVNTLRIITFRKGEEVYIMETVLKMGNGGVIDNFAQGGMYTFVDDKGIVIAPAIDKNGNIHEIHPATKTKIVGYQVPLFEELKEFVQKAGKVVPEMRYIGWDVAITPDGPAIVEGNEQSGVFQLKPSLSNDKIGDLPKYKKHMDIL